MCPGSGAGCRGERGWGGMWGRSGWERKSLEIERNFCLLRGFFLVAMDGFFKIVAKDIFKMLIWAFLELLRKIFSVAKDFLSCFLVAKLYFRF